LDGVFRRRNLPHWDVPDAAYFATACLDGSVPALGLQQLKEYRSELDQRECPAGLTDAEWKYRKRKLAFTKYDELLDHRPAVRHLEDPQLAEIVRSAMLYFAGTRYDQIAYVVMPIHIHWVFQPIREWSDSLEPKRTPREVIIHSLKSYTANLCNRALGRTGRFWQDESYDHWVLDLFQRAGPPGHPTRIVSLQGRVAGPPVGVRQLLQPDAGEALQMDVRRSSAECVKLATRRPSW